MKKISLMSLVLLIVAAIDSIRNLPAASVFGSQLVFFFIFAALIFLLPVALCSAELAAKDASTGGVYNWILKAFGEKWAMVAIWLQWINTMVWFPTILSFIAGTIAYLIHPSLIENRYFIMSMTAGIFWLVTFVNLKGIHFTVKVNSLSAISGTVIPMIFLIALGGIWWMTGHPSQISFSLSSVFPDFGNMNQWVSLVAIMSSFLGMELSGVHIRDVNNPQKNFPRAVAISSLFILVTMLLGSLAIAVVLPSNEISLVAGVMQVFGNFFSHFGLTFLTPVLALSIIFGSTGGLINWIISPARGLMEAASLGYMPKKVLKTNKWGVEYPILIIQAVFVTLVCALFMFVESVNSFYWFLTALSTELYMLMYVLMFFALYKLRHKRPEGKKVFEIPGKSFGKMIVIFTGLFGCLLTIFISFFPPETLKLNSFLEYGLWIAFGNFITLCPLIFFFNQKRRYLKKQN
jgi:glutamate:GABA antiporter